jgi:hypothetical protein
MGFFILLARLPLAVYAFLPARLGTMVFSIPLARSVHLGFFWDAARCDLLVC